MKRLPLLLALFAFPLAAQEHPNQARGFEAGKAYQIGEVDSVNLFNGNLTLTLPIGRGYPANASFSYSLTLVYNSNLWKYEETDNFTPPNINTPATLAEPDPVFNAGLGWMVTLGRLFAPSEPTFNDTPYWVYLSPDGSRHTFYATQHESETDAPSGGDFFYTRDGSYLRLQASIRRVESPDGTKHTFAANTAGFLTRLEDRFGNFLSVNMSNALDRVLSDNLGRTHHIRFGSTFLGTTRLISQIDLAGFNGGTASYVFSYLSPTIYRTCKDTSWGNNSPPTAAGIDQLSVPLLTQVSGPEGLVFSMKDAGNLADYHAGAPRGSGPQAGSPCMLGGAIESLTLPTKGKLSWTYGFWRFPKYTNDSDPHNHPSFSMGVAGRTLDDPFSTADGTWTYANTIFPDPGTISNPAREVRTTVIDPTGAKVVHYFTAPQSLNGTTFRGWEYGLPFSWDTSVAGKYLSREVFDAGSTKVRQQWVTYEHDLLGPTPTNEPSLWYDTNRRVGSERTTFLDDGGKYLDSNSSEFDGLGHYRVATRQSDFDPAVSDAETARVQFNSGTSCYTVDPNANQQLCTGGSAFVPWATNQPWVLGTFGYQQTNQGVIARTFTTFEGQTGFLSCERILKTGTARGANDVLVLYERDSQGNVTAESYYGGDQQTLGTSPGCGVSGSWAYRLEHAYAGGVRASTRYRKSTTAGDFMPFYSSRADIDSSTGLPKVSYDTAGFPTALTWDLLGRLKTSESASSVSNLVKGAKTTYTYTNATTNPAKVGIALTCPAGVSCIGAPYGESEMLFDGFGRVWKERMRMADGSWSKRLMTYNALGWKTTESEQIPDTIGDFALLATRFQGFDAFGRPNKIVPPDAADGNAPHAISINYSGQRAVSRTVRVATVAGSETDSTTTEIYDGQGRLMKVQEPSGAGGAVVTTTYGYDVGDRLQRVCQQASGGTCGQERLFTYDNRGFLASETHPEKGGPVTYGGYDARGHAAAKTDGLATRDLAFFYDQAERLREVREDNASGRLLKSWSYDTATGWGSGKVVAAEGYNYFTVPAATVRVIETYTYNGIEGRTSQKTTRNNFNGADFELFTQGFTYDQAGNLATLTYPTCTGGGCNAGPLPPTPRVVSYSTTNGTLTSVPGYASSIGYHANGMLASIGHSNGVTDSIAVGSDWMARPMQISTSSVALSQNFDTGAMAYDGAGNIKAMGTHSFLYDKVSRLTSGSVRLPSWVSATTYTQGYSFDPFGNLTGITGTNARAISTSAATNRLTGAATYDEAGNLTSHNGTVYEWDRLNRLQKMTTAAGLAQEIWAYIYTAADERFWSLKLNGPGSLWSLRDLSGNLIRQFEAHISWSTTKDSIFREGQLLASEHPADGTRHYHLDHLGTPRLITGPGAAMVAHHTYFPFGEEVSGSTVNTEKMKFTGHERDLNNLGGSGDDLDYMHARFHSPVVGRFLSVDKIPGKAGRPQSWNRYTYAVGNPIIFVDPNGLEPLHPVLLQFFNAFFGDDFSSVQIYSGVAGAIAGMFTGGMAITVGERIFVPGSFSSSDRKPYDVAFLSHELNHVYQYRVQGPLFGQSYLQSYIYNRTQGGAGGIGMSDQDAYENIIHEEISGRVQEVVGSFLRVNADIAQKLDAGVPLNAEELGRVGGALAEAEKNGTFKTGLQFVQGFLVRIPSSQ